LGAVTIWGALLGLFTTPFLITHLGASSYGVFALITIISAYLLNLEFGFGHATIRFLARARASASEQEETEVLGNSLVVFLPAAVAGVAIVFLGAGFIVDHFAHGPTELRGTFMTAIRLGALIIGFSFLTAFASASLQALGRFGAVIKTRGALGTLSSLSSVSVAAAGGGLDAVLVAQVVIAGSLCVILLGLLNRATAAPLRPRFHRAMFKAMAGFGGFILLAGVATQAMIQGPPTVLAGYSTTSQVAAFAVPNLVLQQLVGLVGATSLGFLPFVSGASVRADRHHLGAVYVANLRLSLLVIGPVAVFLAVFAHPLLSTWITPSFAAKAEGPLRFLAAGIVILALSAPPADVARGLGHPSRVAAYTGLSAAATVGLAFLAVPGHGAGGAAFALAVGLALTTIPFVFVIGRSLLSLRGGILVRAFLGPGAALGLLALIDLAGVLISPSFVSAVITGIAGTVAYAVVTFAAVLDARERGVFRGVLERIRFALVRRRRDLRREAPEGLS
jgi:O-antigen/teichoic acid export membrane protein